MDEIEQILRSQHTWIDRKVGGMSRRQRKIVAAALERVHADLLSVEAATWGAAERQAVVVLLTKAIASMTRAQVDELAAEFPSITKAAVRHSATTLQALDQQFAGSVRPLRFDTLEWWERKTKGIGQVRLREFRRSFRRYGAEAVQATETALAKTLVLGQPWYEARKEVWAAVRSEVGDRQWMVDRILRTEASAAYNGTALQTLIEEDDPEDPMFKKLVATFDRRTGKDSVYLHGQTKPVKKPFYDAVRGREYMAPPNRPHDREIVIGWRKSFPDDLDIEPVPGDQLEEAKAEAARKAVASRAPDTKVAASKKPRPTKPAKPKPDPRLRSAQQQAQAQEAADLLTKIQRLKGQAATLTSPEAKQLVVDQLRDTTKQLKAKTEQLKAVTKKARALSKKLEAPPSAVKASRPSKTARKKPAKPPAKISMDEVPRDLPDKEILRSLRETTAVKPAPSRKLDTHLSGYRDATPDEIDKIATGQIPTKTGRQFEPAKILIQPGAHEDGFPGIIIRDGNHRLEAARQAGAKYVIADVIVDRGGRSRTYRGVLIRVGR